MAPSRIIVVGKEPKGFPKTTGYWTRYRGHDYNLNTETAHQFWFRAKTKKEMEPTKYPKVAWPGGR